MERCHYEAIASLQASNWWYASRRHLLARLVRRFSPFERCLEVGSGMGANLPLLRDELGQVFSSDLDLAALVWSRSAAGAAAHCADISALPFADEQFDLVVAMDVLEHVDDAAATREIHRLLREGGRLIATVPAHAFLWNDNDDASHHLRRYSRGTLRRLLCGFEIEHLAPWNFLTFVPMAGFAAWSRVRPPRRQRNNLERVPSAANRLLYGLSRLENRLREVAPMPFGTSFAAVARRRDGVESRADTAAVREIA